MKKPVIFSFFCIHVAMILSLIFMGNKAHAFSATDFQRMKTTGPHQCVSCDLSGIDIEGWEMGGAILKKSDLRHANLAQVELDLADLSGVDLRNANVFRVVFSHANLSNANLSKLE